MYLKLGKERNAKEMVTVIQFSRLFEYPFKFFGMPSQLICGFCISEVVRQPDKRNHPRDLEAFSVSVGEQCFHPASLDSVYAHKRGT